MIKNFNINKNSTQSGRSLLSKCAGYTQYFLSDVYTNSTQTKKAQVETVQCGRSMIEMLGVLAIVGVLSVGGIAGYSKAMTKFKINKTADQISHIATNIRTLYAQQTSYAGLNTVSAINMGVTPDELGTNANLHSYSSNTPALTNVFGGRFEILTSGKTGTSSDDAFIIQVGDLPLEACVSLATMDWGSSSSSGLIAISIDSWNPYLSDALVDSCSSGGQQAILHCSKDGIMSVARASASCKLFENNAATIALKFY